MDNVTNAGAQPANELSLRDELAASFEKASKPDSSPAQPEEAAQPEAEAGQPRDDKGRFATKDGQPVAEASQAAKPAEQPKPQEAKPDEQPQAQQPEAKTYAGPPPGWSVQAKAAYATLPDEVKEAIGRREQEIDKGFARLKDLKEIESAHGATAQKYGVSVKELIDRYMNAEAYLQRDPVNAIKWLAQSYGIDIGQLAGNAQPTEPAHAAPAPNAEVLQPLLQELNSLKQIVYGDKRSQVENQVERFFADPNNKYAENVSDQMLVLINEANRNRQPVDLPQIYETACFMNPEVRAALIRERAEADKAEQVKKAQQIANQARQAGASIAGGPSKTPPPVSPDLDLRSMLEQQFAQAGVRG